MDVKLHGFVFSHITSQHNFTAAKISEVVGKRT